MPHVTSLGTVSDPPRRVGRGEKSGPSYSSCCPSQLTIYLEDISNGAIAFCKTQNTLEFAFESNGQNVGVERVYDLKLCNTFSSLRTSKRFPLQVFTNSYTDCGKLGSVLPKDTLAETDRIGGFNPATHLLQNDSPIYVATTSPIQTENFKPRFRKRVLYHLNGASLAREFLSFSSAFCYWRLLGVVY